MITPIISTAIETRAEHEAIVCCARTYMDAKSTARLKTLLQKDIDWNYLLETAKSHGVIQLLYFNLSTVCSELLPVSVLTELKDNYYGNTSRNLRLTGELIKLLNLLSENGIAAIPFKGPTLAASVYNHLGWRQFCDLDILVRQQDFLNAKNLLSALGYQSQCAFEWQHSFIHTTSQVEVDLHQRSAPRYFPLKLNFDYLYSRLQSISLSGTTVAHLSPEDLLLILCAQLAKDFVEHRQKLAQICDIAELLRVHQNIDWEYITNLAEKLGIKRILFLALSLTTMILDADVPETVGQKMRTDSKVDFLASHLRSQLFCKKIGWFESLKRPFFYINARERLRDKMRYIGIRFILPKIVVRSLDIL